MRISSDKQLPKLDTGEYSVASVPGMSVRISPRGCKSFRLRYRIFPETKLHSMPLGRYPDISLKDASARARAALGDAVRGIDPGAFVREARTKTDPVFSFCSLIERYDREWCAANFKARSAHDKILLLNREWGTKAKFANLDVRKITSEKIVSHLSVIIARGQHDANALASLKSFFKWLYGQRIVTTVPTDGVRHNSKSKPRSRFLSHDELKKVWFATDKMGYPFGHVVKLLLLTATRRVEVGGMRWDEIDFDQREWTIPHDRTKKQRNSTPQPHLIPLTEPALELLQSIPQTDDVFVFPGVRGDKHMADWDKRKKRLDEISTITDYGLHDLRRTAVTEFGRLKIAPHIKKAILHHSSRDVMDLHYDKFEYVDEKREALERWGEHLMRIVHA
jgi:integrase